MLLVKFNIFSQKFRCWTSLYFTDQETQEEIFGGTSSLVGQFLHPSPVQSSRSIQTQADNPKKIVHKQVLSFNFVPAVLNVGPDYASQITKLRKRILSRTSSCVGQSFLSSPIQSSGSIQAHTVVQYFLNIECF